MEKWVVMVADGMGLLWWGCGSLVSSNGLEMDMVVVLLW